MADYLHDGSVNRISGGVGLAKSAYNVSFIGAKRSVLFFRRHPLVRILERGPEGGSSFFVS